MISLKTCLDVPIRPLPFKEDLGVKNRVKDRGVIVGGLRGLLPYWVPDNGTAGEDIGSFSFSNTVVLGLVFSCEPVGVRFSMEEI